MKRNIWILSILAILMAVGCIDDKTSLPTFSIPLPDSVIITNNATGEKQVLTEEEFFYFTIQPGEELSLSAQVFDQTSSNYRYEWQVSIIDVKANTVEMETASETETLERTVYENLSGALLVYRDGNESAFTYPFNLTIASPYATGIMIVGNQGGEGVLDFIEISTTTEDVEFNGSTVANFTLVNHIPHENVYSLCNNGEEFPCDNVITVRKMSGNGFTSEGFQMITYYQILDADYTKAVTVSNTSMEKVTMLSDEFTEIPDNFRPVNFIDNKAVSLILDESGDVYARINYDAGLPCTGRFTPEPLVFDDPINGSEAIEATQIYPGGLIYEASKKRFIKAESIDNTSISINSLLESTLLENYISLNNFEVDKLLDISIYDPSSSSQIVNQTFFIMYQKNGEYYIQSLSYQNTMGLFTSCRPISSLKVPDNVKQLWEAGVSQFANQVTSAYPTVTGYLYFASGNALYRTTLSGANLEKLLECDSRITHFALSTYSTRVLSTAAEKYINGNVYTVALENGDVEVIKIYEDPQQPGTRLQEVLWEKNYDGGVSGLTYCSEF